MKKIKLNTKQDFINNNGRDIIVSWGQFINQKARIKIENNTVFILQNFYDGEYPIKPGNFEHFLFSIVPIFPIDSPENGAGGEYYLCEMENIKLVGDSEVLSKAFKLGYVFHDPEPSSTVSPETFLFLNESGFMHVNKDFNYYNNCKSKPLPKDNFLNLPEPKPEIQLSEKKDKPPLGVRPKYIAYQERFNEIITGIHNYVLSGKQIPYDWYDEYNDLYHIINSKE